jgi:chemotaxis methyl-accepting protein methylase
MAYVKITQTALRLRLPRLEVQNQIRRCECESVLHTVLKSHGSLAWGETDIIFARNLYGYLADLHQRKLFSNT